MVQVQRTHYLNGYDVRHSTWRTGPLTRASGGEKDEMNSFHFWNMKHCQLIAWRCHTRPPLCSHQVRQLVCMCDVAANRLGSRWRVYCRRAVHEKCGCLGFMKCFNSPFINGGTIELLICEYITSNDWMHFLFLFWGYSTCLGPPAEDELIC